ncbi:hypothetical protein P280DRAFT_481030 [Massarina eburnea CBS 473.64]|uniref:Uncharacterized protein n=1 Tax=Massarina eburnea CBS 473.64 TaxID=1395130 RepID=A0A6A6RZJ2_9PLEO|nr:hypothetical protein P280DRAFT_481030 [Massarina eburnea CBS 473.64]
MAVFFLLSGYFSVAAAPRRSRKRFLKEVWRGLHWVWNRNGGGEKCGEGGIRREDFAFVPSNIPSSSSSVEEKEEGKEKEKERLPNTIPLLANITLIPSYGVFTPVHHILHRWNRHSQNFASRATYATLRGPSTRKIDDSRRGDGGYNDAVQSRIRFL